jgi:CBS domain-containing protein
MQEILIGAALLAAGVGVVWVAKRLNIELGEASKTAVVLLPLLLFLVLSDKVTEFEGLGWKAKFRDAVKERVVDTARASDLMISSPEANKPNFYQEAYWLACRPYYVLTNTTAKLPNDTDKLNQQAVIDIAVAIRSSILCGRFVGVIVVDDGGKPVGLFRPDLFLEILRIPLVTWGPSATKATNVFEQIAGTELGVVLKDPVIRAESDDAERVIVAANADLETAYKALIEKNARAAMISDRFGRFDGIITRSAIEGRIIQKLLASTK